MNLAQKIAHNAALRELEKQDVPCCECGTLINAAGEGVCAPCREALGWNDDTDPFRGPVFMEITEGDYEAANAERYEDEIDHRRGRLLFPIRILPPGVAELIAARDALEIPF